jgi:FeS assembly SUF system protein
MKHFADEEMTKNALGDEYDELAIPPNCEATKDHKMWPEIESALKDIFDPEIPVNIYELGLIYKVDITNHPERGVNVFVEMTLTSPGCPVAQDMPVWVQGAIMALENVQDVDVDIVWDPVWDPSMMAETAKLQLNMFT